MVTFVLSFPIGAVSAAFTSGHCVTVALLCAGAGPSDGGQRAGRPLSRRALMKASHKDGNVCGEYCGPGDQPDPGPNSAA